MKNKLKVYKLHFTTPLHIGNERADYGVSLKTYQSDAMYAALISCLAKIGEDIPDNGDLGFVISSLFPFYQKDSDAKAVYFFPKLLHQQLPKLNDVSKAKDIKKVSWLETSFFEKIINGYNLFENEDDIKNIDGIFLTSEKIESDFISSQVMQRVTVSRDFSEDAKPFYMDRIHFKDKSGLFFIVNGDTNLLDAALNILQHEGIGTDRNVGNGYFEVKTDVIELDLPNSDMVTNLSMFCPESEMQLSKMLNHDKVAYDFTKRGGWITTNPYNTYRKKTIQMFTPASVFNFKDEMSKPAILGKIVDLNPNLSFEKIDHSIWRTGRSIFIPIKLNE
jgi:CRISPR type III-A-associated RAMP protein Csm4